jgi:hypothetical protein
MRGAKSGTRLELEQPLGLAGEVRSDTAAAEAQLEARELDRLHYMADLIAELQSLANDMQQSVLARLLSLAHIEALRETADAKRHLRASRRTV